MPAQIPDNAKVTLTYTPPPKLKLTRGLWFQYSPGSEWLQVSRLAAWFMIRDLRDGERIVRVD